VRRHAQARRKAGRGVQPGGERGGLLPEVDREPFHRMPEIMSDLGDPPTVLCGMQGDDKCPSRRAQHLDVRPAYPHHLGLSR
jgi:hypothetical protein